MSLVRDPISARALSRRSLAFPVRLLPWMSLLLCLTLLGVVPAASAAQPRVDPPPNGFAPEADYGDAPDSSNNLAVVNNAYPGIPGRFPTVWRNTAIGDGAGPRHFNSLKVWLGEAITPEGEADLPIDPDGKTNILENGNDKADDDLADDGWINRDARFPDCQETTLFVKVLRNPSSTEPLPNMYLNVWFDGNRDGDWADQRLCSDGQRTSFEWIARNLVVPSTSLTPFVVIPVRTMLVLNAKPQDKAWVRFTLSEIPVESGRTPAGLPVPADGRGPQAPNGYQLGETEDYLYTPPTDTVNPGQILIRKRANTKGTLEVGSVFSYTIDLKNDGLDGSPPVTVAMSDTLPPEVVLVGNPVALLTTKTISAPTTVFAQFESSLGPRGTVGWKGDLGPGDMVSISFSVRVDRCPVVNAANVGIRNVARARTPNGVLESAVSVAVTCAPPPKPTILFRKLVVPLADDNPNAEAPKLASTGDITGVADLAVPPGSEVLYLIQLLATSELSQSAQISDTLPLGLVGVEALASRGDVILQNEGRTMLWRGPIGGDTEPLTIKLRARFTPNARCDGRIENVAYLTLLNQSGRVPSNPAYIRLACSDLGDAPDSTNHFNLPMKAYEGVAANFPTVWDGPLGAPRGPKHAIAGPLRLGTGVSNEAEADLGFDTDGVNNLEFVRTPTGAPLGQANLDKRDDGVLRERLKFANCQRTEIPVVISSDLNFTKPITISIKTAYLNVWIDSNRDGDWGDSFQCPGATTSEPLFSAEHLVIDYPVDLTTITGTVQISVPTSLPVFWPAEKQPMPSWLRVTLSDRPANKTLPDGCLATNTCRFGDGRGYVEPFRLGETEDYLLLPRQPGGNGNPDLVVEKRGKLRPAFEDEARPQLATTDDRRVRDWVIDWAIAYRNAGDGAVRAVVLEDQLSGPQGDPNSRPAPTSDDGGILSYSLGDLAPGQGGFIALRTRVNPGTPPGTVLTNTVTISADGDVDLSNNTAIVTLTVPLLPPQIISPIPGTTCTGVLTITGITQPGTSVELTMNQNMVTLQPQADGSWSYAATLPDGTYELSAVTVKGALRSDPSPVVRVVVDSSLGWSPISLRFVDSDGYVAIPRDANGRTDATGWSIRLRPNTSYTVTVRLCCDDPNAQVVLTVPAVGEVMLTDPDGDHIFSASFTTGDRGQINSVALKICVTCHKIISCSDGTVLIDPEGVVYDVTKGLAAGLLADATVACYQAQTVNGATSFTLWPAADFGQINPQITKSDGYFSFFTPAGTFRLGVTRNGYQSYRSRDIVVTDTPVEFNVPLTPNVTGTATTVYVGIDGFDQPALELTEGSVLELINSDVTPRSVNGSGGTTIMALSSYDSGLLTTGSGYRLQLGPGTYSFTDPQNPAAQLTVVVKAATPQRLVYIPLSLR